MDTGLGVKKVSRVGGREDTVTMKTSGIWSFLLPLGLQTSAPRPLSCRPEIRDFATRQSASTKEQTGTVP